MAIELFKLLHSGSYIHNGLARFSLRLTNGVLEEPPEKSVTKAGDRKDMKFLFPLECDRDCPLQLLNNPILDLPDLQV